MTDKTPAEEFKAAFGIELPFTYVPERDDGWVGWTEDDGSLDGSETTVYVRFSSYKGEFDAALWAAVESEARAHGRFVDPNTSSFPPNQCRAGWIKPSEWPGVQPAEVEDAEEDEVADTMAAFDLSSDDWDASPPKVQEALKAAARLTQSK